jgi:hypothetical protein
MTNKQTATAYCLRVMNDSVWLCADCVDRFKGSTNEERAELLVAWTGKDATTGSLIEDGWIRFPSNRVSLEKCASVTVVGWCLERTETKHRLTM